jgi:hypothetical protein
MDRAVVVEFSMGSTIFVIGLALYNPQDLLLRHHPVDRYYCSQLVHLPNPDCVGHERGDLIDEQSYARGVQHRFHAHRCLEASSLGIVKAFMNEDAWVLFVGSSCLPVGWGWWSSLLKAV